MTQDQIERFEGTELEGVLPSLTYVREHLAQFDNQFALAIKHLDNAAKAVLRVGAST